MTGARLVGAAEAEREFAVPGLARRLRVRAHRGLLFSCGLDVAGRPLYSEADIRALLASDTPNVSVPDAGIGP